MRSAMLGTIMACIFASSVMLCQQQSNPEKPKFGDLQCRADAQKWTFDPFEEKDVRFSTGTAILVNGQFRVLPYLTYHATMTDLMKRAYEMDMCITEDADFQKQFNTYAIMYRAYSDEQTFRYKNFVMKHGLEAQFTKEDTEQFK